MKVQSNSSILNRIRLAAIKKIARSIIEAEPDYREMTDAELANQTQVFKQRLQDGETLDDLLVEAFATVREACFRKLGQFPYPVQVMGAIALHQGSIAEMKTGEGKTLTATMPLYLNALEGKGAILVTTNDYLALRDGEEMRPVFELLGLTVGIGAKKETGNEAKEKTEQEKKRVYFADITYTTSAILGFDYLTNNLASSPEGKFMREFHYVVVDEADAVLLDSAQTPLIISGAPRVQSNLFDTCNQFVLTLKEGEEFYFDGDKKEVYLTDKGNDYAESYFAIEGLYTSRYWELNRHINLALRAHYLFRKNFDYIVEDDEVKLLDNRTGRILEGTRLQSGIHQAIETKEGVKKTKESRAMGSVTYQSLFNMFPKIAGMTGTGHQAENELIETYGIPVVTIPTNKPVRRMDYPDKIYTTLPEKLAATIAMVKELHAKGQPVLLVSGTVEITLIYSKLLLQEGIPHSTLTASNIPKEAAIIQEAGQYGVVTCATIMAGRGTDIKLGQGVAELGGLAVIGTERMVNSRMDWQLRGRAGRQGEPGLSQFFVSLEDELLVMHGPDWVGRYFKKHNHDQRKNYGKPLQAGRFQRALKHAQEKSEDSAVSSRRFTIEYDESMKIQRNKIYALRDRLILETDNLSEKIEDIVQKTIAHFLAEHPDRDDKQLRRYILDNFTYGLKQLPTSLTVTSDREVGDFLYGLFVAEMQEKGALLGTEEGIAEFYRLAVLKAIDEAWVEEVDTLQQLKGVLSSRSTAQRGGVPDYYRESLRSYQKMTQQVQEKTVRNMMLSTISVDKEGNYSIYFV